MSLVELDVSRDESPEQQCCDEDDRGADQEGPAALIVRRTGHGGQRHGVAEHQHDRQKRHAGDSGDDDEEEDGLEAKLNLLRKPLVVKAM